MSVTPSKISALVTALTNKFALAGHTHTGMLTSSDIANNLTTTTTGKMLDATQGKALKDLIGNAITYINQ